MINFDDTYENVKDFLRKTANFLKNRKHEQWTTFSESCEQPFQ